MNRFPEQFGVVIIFGALALASFSACDPGRTPSAPPQPKINGASEDQAGSVPDTSPRRNVLPDPNASPGEEFDAAEQ